MTSSASTPIAVVTGATSGIGRYIARGLALAGYHVAIVGRDLERTNATIAWLKDEVADAHVEGHVADLSSLRATRTLGEKLLGQHPIIHRLVTNAGIFSARHEITAEGHEKVLAVNHLSPFTLTNILLPALRAAGTARIIAIGSDTSDRANIDPDNLELHRKWNYLRAYRRSKLAQMMTTFELAEKLSGSGVTANVAHPGAVATNLVRTKGVIGLAWKIMAPFILTEEQGAKTPLYVALNDEASSVTGQYFKKCRTVAPNRLALNKHLRRSVWNATDQLVRS